MMIDAEVLRLRTLRNLALRMRALGRRLASEGGDEGAFSRGVLLSWLIVRLVTGHLRSHPYAGFGRWPGRARVWFERTVGTLVAMQARQRRRPFSVYSEQLQKLACALDDARALTRSADLSDALGRAQSRMRRMIHELGLRAQSERGGPSRALVRAREPEVLANPTARALVQVSASREWPYMAIPR